MMNMEQGSGTDEKHIPRPPNAFMVYGRSQRSVLAKQYPEMTNKQISKILGQKWRCLEEKEKDHFRQLANEAYHKHMQMHPNYYYSPLEARQRKAERKRKYMQKCGRKTGAANQLQDDYKEQMIAIQAISQSEGEQQAANDVQLIPVICHHPVRNGNQTLLSFSLAPVLPNEQFFPQFGVPINLSDEEAAIRHCYGDVGVQLQPPTIYHVSHKDPNLGEISFNEQLTVVNEMEMKQDCVSSNVMSDVYSNFLPPMENNAISVIEVNPNHRESVIVAKAQDKPKVIVKKVPNENDPFIFSSAIDVLNNEDVLS